LAEIVPKLLKRGSDPRHQQTNGMTALLWASYKCNEEIVDYLIDNNAWLDAKDKLGETAIHKAVD